jgi:hypothetical protein
MHEPQEERAADLHQTEGYKGSFGPDDPDRPRWGMDTRLTDEFDYQRRDGSYDFTVLKGRDAKGEKHFLKGRRFLGSVSDLAMARQDRQRFQFYKFPGLEHYEKGAGDKPTLLYRLPEFTNDLAARPDDPVCIMEGEKDTETARGLGFIATTNANGALDWPAEYNELFAGRDVLIFIDNDDNGRDRAPVIVEQIGPIANSVRVVELPGLPLHGDLTDWLESGKTKADLLKVIAESPPVTSAAEWRRARQDFITDEDGKRYSIPENVRILLARIGVSVSYDEFAARYLVKGLPGFGPVLDDAALLRLRLIAEEDWRLKFGKDRWAEIVTDYARHNTFHPVRQYLGKQTWDGVDRLAGWLVNYAGAEDNEYVRAVAAIVLIAAVRRVRQPGCKFDELLVLESPQGTDKSTALGILAVHEDWFTDDMPLDADSKVLMERIAGRWLVEIAELKGMKRGDVEHVKAALSRRVDKARLAYGRMVTEQPRQCVFFGTTNHGEYLRDTTGNRRFWPVKVNKFDLAALRRDRDQLWAEAAAREAAGESIRLPERLWSAAGEQQAHREVGDPFYEILSARLHGLEGKVRGSDIWEAVGLGDAKYRTQDHNVRLSATMQKLGWRRPKSVLRFDGKPQLAWVKGEVGAAVDAYPEVPRAVVLGQDQPASGRVM